MAMTLRIRWTPEQARILDEARIKLTRSRTRNAVIAVAGLVGTILSFVVLPGGGGVLFYGAILFGPIAAMQADRNLKHLDQLTPADPLNKRTLGVRTSADPPESRTGIIVLASLIGLVVLAMVVMVVTH